MINIVNIDYFRTYCALVQRNFVVIKKRYKSAIINSGIPLIIQVLTAGYFFPLMGVPEHLISPLFVGNQVLIMFFFGMGFGLRIVFDIKYSRFIDYQLTLPLPKRWLIASYVTYFMMDAALISAPIFTFGIIFLGTKFQMINPHPFLFLIVYCLTLCLYALIFLGLSIYYEYWWFMPNLWPRRLTLLITFSPIFYVWKTIYSFSPNISYIMLANPLTYTTEGMRSTLIGGSEFISWLICIPMLLIWISLTIAFVAYSITKRLDPV